MEFHKEKLLCGATLIGEYHRNQPLGFAIGIPYGGGHDSNELRGAAHFMEHFLFKKTGNGGINEISKRLERRGGYLNAGTGFGSTTVYFKLPSRNGLYGVRKLLDLVVKPSFPESQLKTELNVVREEIHKYQDNPELHVEDLIGSSLYEPPFGECVLGNLESLVKFNVSNIKDLFEKNYTHDNFVIAYAGDIEIEKLRDLLNSKLTSFSNAKKMDLQPKKRFEKLEIERRDISQVKFVFGIHGPLPSNKNYSAFKILGSLLTDGSDSILYDSIRERRGLAYEVSNSFDSSAIHSYYTIKVGTEEKNLRLVKELILDGFEHIEKKLSPRKFKMVKRMLSDRIDSEQLDSMERAIDLCETQICGKNPESLCKKKEEILEVDIEQVKELAKINDYASATIFPSE